MNICPDGKRPTTKLPAQAVAQLKKWLSDHSQSPYPTQNEKEDLAATTCLSLYQVKTWFANARRRIKGETKKATKLTTNVARPDVQVTSSESEQMPTVSSTENLRQRKVNVTHNAVPKRSTRRESSTPVDELQPEAIKRHRVEPAALPQVFPANSHGGNPGSDWTSTAPGTANFQPVLSPPIFGYEAWPDLNASRSLQALAGMCDNIKQTNSSIFTFNPSNNAAPVGQYPSPSPLNSPPRATIQPPLKTPDPRSHTLWQPFKSTDDLPGTVDQCCGAKNSQTTAVRSNACSMVLPSE